MDLMFYTLRQTAELLHLSEYTVRRKIKQGLIPRSPLSGHILVPTSFFHGEKKIEPVASIYGEDGFEPM